MQIFCLGTSHKSAPIDMRERLSVTEGEGVDLLSAASGTLAEGVFLSTCNRTEVYGAAEDLAAATDVVLELLARRGGFSVAALRRIVYVHADEMAVRHLFRVVSGLDALVVGETQIIAQTKAAYDAASRAGLAGAVLSPLFQEALAVAARIQTDTAINRFGVSVGHAAVELAESVLGDLGARAILLIGAGELAELCLVHIRERSAGRVLVANRTLDGALRLADDVGGRAVPFTSLVEALAEVDIVIGSTAAPHAVLDAPAVEAVMGRRQGRELFFFDLAVPRDFEASIGEIPGVHLYDIDDLQSVVDSHQASRRSEAGAAEALAKDAARLFVENQKARRAVPLIRQLTARAEEIRRGEVARALRRLPELTAREREIIEAMASLLVRKLLNDPLLALKEMAKEGDAEEHLAEARRLFNLPPGADGTTRGLGS